MSEAGDWDPGPWTGHDFKSAKQKYDIHVGRSYEDALSTKTDPSRLVPKSLASLSAAPLVIACDVTGSMGESPATIFSKCPYLDLEAKTYLGDDMEICFAAVGDAYSDKYPLQVREFARGLDLKKRLEELIIEGGGGGQSCESYELAALYFASHVSMPNAVKPIMIFIGDEGLYDFVSPDHARDWCFMQVKNMSTKDIFEALKAKFSVYIIRQPYQKEEGDKESDADKRIHAQWAALLGEDHMAFLPDAARVVDVIFGILAKETHKIDYFKDEITQRQTPAQVKTVMKGLVSIHALPEPAPKKNVGKSVVTKQRSKKGDSQSLL